MPPPVQQNLDAYPHSYNGLVPDRASEHRDDWQTGVLFDAFLHPRYDHRGTGWFAFLVVSFYSFARPGSHLLLFIFSIPWVCDDLIRFFFKFFPLFAPYLGTLLLLHCSAVFFFLIFFSFLAFVCHLHVLDSFTIA